MQPDHFQINNFDDLEVLAATYGLNPGEIYDLTEREFMNFIYGVELRNQNEFETQQHLLRAHGYLITQYIVASNAGKKAPKITIDEFWPLPGTKTSRKPNLKQDAAELFDIAAAWHEKGII